MKFIERIKHFWKLNFIPIIRLKKTVEQENGNTSEKKKNVKKNKGL